MIMHFLFFFLDYRFTGLRYLPSGLSGLSGIVLFSSLMDGLASHLSGMSGRSVNQKGHIVKDVYPYKKHIGKFV